MSKLAYKQVLNGDKTNLIGEHIVPVSVILTELNKIKNINLNSISDTIKKHSTKAVITKPEDQRLRALGLQKPMPDNWCGNDIMARYKHAKIDLVDKPYKEVVKMYNKHFKMDEHKAARPLN